jgi:type III secretion protein F
MALISGLGVGSSVTFDLLNNTIYKGIQTQETNLVNELNTLGSQSDVSATDLLQAQQLQQQWTMMINMQSTMSKDISDALKGIIQNSS